METPRIKKWIPSYRWEEPLLRQMTPKKVIITTTTIGNSNRLSKRQIRVPSTKNLRSHPILLWTALIMDFQRLVLLLIIIETRKLLVELTLGTLITLVSRGKVKPIVTSLVAIAPKGWNNRWSFNKKGRNYLLVWLKVVKCIIVRVRDS